MNYILLIVSVFFGALLVYVAKPSNKIVRLLLAFSGAYLLSVTILHGPVKISYMQVIIGINR
jgi:hypothetical protein